MSITTSHRPILSPWNELTGQGMTKEAVNPADIVKKFSGIFRKAKPPLSFTEAGAADLAGVGGRLGGAAERGGVPLVEGIGAGEPRPNDWIGYKSLFGSGQAGGSARAADMAQVAQAARAARAAEAANLGLNIDPASKHLKDFLGKATRPTEASPGISVKFRPSAKGRAGAGAGAGAGPISSARTGTPEMFGPSPILGPSGHPVGPTGPITKATISDMPGGGAGPIIEPPRVNIFDANKHIANPPVPPPPTGPVWPGPNAPPPPRPGPGWPGPNPRPAPPPPTNIPSWLTSPPRPTAAPTQSWLSRFWERQRPTISGTAKLGIPAAAGTWGTAKATEAYYAAQEAAAKQQAGEADTKIKALLNPPKKPEGGGGAGGDKSFLDSAEQGMGEFKKYVTEHWPWLLGGGAALGGAGLWIKNYMDRKKEEEEEALLSGMHKASMVKLATAFPVQFGFLARCGERKLNNAEVQEAIEKCASISDGMADDWIRFFDTAARIEAEASLGMMKTAIISGVAPLKAPAGTVAAEPAPTPTATSAPATVPTAAPAAPVAPVPAVPRTNIQQSAYDRPSDEIVAQRQAWLAQYNEASKQNDSARMKYLQTNKPGMQAKPMGVAGQDRPALTPEMQAAKSELTDPKRQLDEQNLAVRNSAIEGAQNLKRRFVPTAEDVAVDQRAMADRMNQGPGMTWDQAQAGNFSSPANDPAVASTAGNIAANLATRTMPGIGLGAPLAIGSDIYSGIRHGNWDFSNTQAVGNDILSPIREGMDPVNPAAMRPELENKSFANDVVPEWSKQLKEIAESGEPMPWGKKYQAGLGNRLLDQYGMLASAPVAASAGPLLSKIPSVGPLAGNVVGAFGPVVAGLTGLIDAGTEGLQQRTGKSGLTPREAAGQHQHLLNQWAGKEPVSAAAAPPPTNLDQNQWDQYIASNFETQRKNVNIERSQQGKLPMNADEEKALADKLTTPLKAQYEQKRQAFVMQQFPTMVDPKTGGYNPKGQLDLSPASGYDPKNTRGYLTEERTQALAHMKTMDQTQLTGMYGKLPMEMQQKIAQHLPLTDVDKASLKNQGIDTDAIQATAQRLTTAEGLVNSRNFGGNMQATLEAMKTPEAMQRAIMGNPELTTKVKEEAAATGTDFMTAATGMWEKLGPMGQMLVGGGMAVGLFGLLNSFLGDGGMGSILATLLGGGAMLLGANKGGLLPQGLSDTLNPILKTLGLDMLAGTPPGVGDAAAAPGAAPGTTPGTAPGTTPGTTPGTAPAGGVPPKFTIEQLRDPNAPNALRALPKAQQASMMKNLDWWTKAKLDMVTGSWEKDPNYVIKSVRDAIGAPDITSEEVGDLVNAWRLSKGS